MERWYRDLQSHRRHGRRGAGLMAINLDDPKKFRPLVGQAHQVAMNMLRPISRKYDRAEHEYPKELDMLAAMIDGLAESGASEGAGAAGVRRDDESTRTARRQERHQPRLGAVDRGDVLGRRRPAAVDAAPGPRQLRDRLGRRRRAARAVRRASGPAMAITEPGHRLRLRQHPHHRASSTATSTSSTARRSSSPPATAADAVVVWATLDKEPRPGGDQVVRGREGHARA